MNAQPYPVDPVTGRAMLGGRAKRYRVDRGLIGVKVAGGVVHLFDLDSKATVTLCGRSVCDLAPLTTATVSRLCLRCGRRRDDMIRGGR